MRPFQSLFCRSARQELARGLSDEKFSSRRVMRKKTLLRSLLNKMVQQLTKQHGIRSHHDVHGWGVQRPLTRGKRPVSPLSLPTYNNIGIQLSVIIFSNDVVNSPTTFIMGPYTQRFCSTTTASDAMEVISRV